MVVGQVQHLTLGESMMLFRRHHRLHHHHHLPLRLTSPHPPLRALPLLLLLLHLPPPLPLVVGPAPQQCQVLLQVLMPLNPANWAQQANLVQIQREGTI
jgi:hypothetical protein